MTLQPIHQGGYLWRMVRNEREAALLRLAADVGKLVLVTRTETEAAALGRRLTLSGLPIRLAVDPSDPVQANAAAVFSDDEVTSLVATHDYVIEQGPISATVVVHTRLPATPRAYLRRLSAVPAPVHVTLVLPEDEKAATALFPQISDCEADPDDSHSLDVVLDLTTGDRPAAIAGGRRRFPLVR